MKALDYFFVVTAPDWEAATHNLFTSDGCENAGVFLCGRSTTDTGVRLLARRFMPVPRQLYVHRHSYHLEIAAAFYNQVVTECEATGLHPVIVHSHPMSGEAQYSKSDDFGERRLLAVLGELLPDRTVASLVVTTGAATGRRLVHHRFVKLSGMEVIGLPSLMLRFGVEHGSTTPDDAFDRQVRAFGAIGQARIRASRIGIVGVGGTGSIVAEQVARLGVRSATVVDNDLVETSNLSRLVGASRRNLGQPKADVIRRHLKSTSGARVVAVNDSALRQDVLMKLRDCDVVFCCVDNDRTRAVLTRFAHQYLIPVIDLGVRLDARSGNVTAAGGRVTVVGAGLTCLRCSHHLSAERIRAESTPENERRRLATEGYILGVDEPAPAVISLNTVVAGLAVTAFLGLLVNLTGAPQPTNQIYDATTGSVFPVAPAHDAGCDICDPIVGVKALGDAQVVSAY